MGTPLSTSKVKGERLKVKGGLPFTFYLLPFTFLVLSLFAWAEEPPDGEHTDAASDAAAPEEEAPEEAAAPAKEKTKISLDLRGVELSELFRILSLKTGLTIVPTKEVSGRINIFLNNQTFEDALDIILVSQDLAYERKGDILYIMTAAEYEPLYGRRYNEKRTIKNLKLTYAQPATVFDALSQIKSEIGKVVVDKTSGTLILLDVPDKLALMEQTVRQLDQPPQTAIFDLKYAASKELKDKLSTAITDGPGQLVVDERSNKMIVSDLPEKMKRLERMVRAFDAEPLQVLIDAAIVEITLSEKFHRGVDWEKIFKEKLESIDMVTKFPVSETLSSSEKITVGIAPRDTFRGFLQLLKTYGDTKILSRPRIAAISGQEAKILVGSREAYVSQTLSQATGSTVTSESVQFIDVGVKLNVVPTVNADGFVTIKIKPEVSSVRETLKTSLGSAIPIVETSEAETVVKVKDGSMIMIGGLMKDDRRDSRNVTPGVEKVPVLRHMFGSRTVSSKKTELIIFLTPHIMRGDEAVPGTEPELLMPTQVMPEDLKQAIIDGIVSRKLGQIRIPAEESLPPPGLKSPELPTRPPVEEAVSGKLQLRLKGLKDH